MSSFFPHTYVQLFGSFSRCTRLVSLKLLGFTSFIRPVLTYTLYELLRHPSPFCCSLSYTLSWSRISLIRISLKQQNSGAEKIWAHQIFKIIHSVGRNVLPFCSLSTVATLKHCWQVMLKSRVPLLSFCFFVFFSTTAGVLRAERNRGQRMSFMWFAGEMKKRQKALVLLTEILSGSLSAGSWFS